MISQTVGSRIAAHKMGLGLVFPQRRMLYRDPYYKGSLIVGTPWNKGFGEILVHEQDFLDRKQKRPRGMQQPKKSSCRGLNNWNSRESNAKENSHAR